MVPVLRCLVDVFPSGVGVDARVVRNLRRRPVRQGGAEHGRSEALRHHEEVVRLSEACGQRGLEAQIARDAPRSAGARRVDAGRGVGREATQARLRPELHGME